MKIVTQCEDCGQVINRASFDHPDGMEDAKDEVRVILRDFAIAMIKRNFELSDTLRNVDDFITEFMTKRYDIS
jgi:hypothetical protein